MPDQPTPPATPTGERPLGLPTGSVRSLIVLILLLVVSIIALALVWRIISDPSEDAFAATKDLALVVIGAIVGALASATAFYFKDRATDTPAP